MTRSLRIDLPGERHHVMNRGARRAPIFRDDTDCEAFLGLVGQLNVRFGIEVHAWSLMPNHYHLLVSCPRGGLGRGLQFVQSRYARHLNRRHAWDGPIFRGRFRNRPIRSEVYWAYLFAYIHLNPVKAHLVARPEEPSWTSHRSFLGLDPAPEWHVRTALETTFPDRAAYQAYIEEVQVGRERVPEGFDPEAMGKVDQDGPEPAVPRGWPLSLDAALVALTSVTAVPRERLLKPKEGRAGGNPMRDLALWWLPQATGVSQAEVGRTLGVDPAVMSRSARRARKRSTEGGDFADWAARLAELMQ